MFIIIIIYCIICHVDTDSSAFGFVLMQHKMHQGSKMACANTVDPLKPACRQTCTTRFMLSCGLFTLQTRGNKHENKQDELLKSKWRFSNLRLKEMALSSFQSDSVMGC
jgi:hypothetical protein